MKRCKHKWNVFNGHPVHWRSFNRAPLRCEMATTGNITLTWSLALCVFLSLAHTLSYTRTQGKKAPNIFCQQDCAYPQPSNNLLPCVYRVFGAKVSLNLNPQSQTSGKPRRNNVYFLSALALFLTMLSVHQELVYLTNSPMICTSSLWKVTQNTLQLILYYLWVLKKNYTQLFCHVLQVMKLVRILAACTKHQCICCRPIDRCKLLEAWKNDVHFIYNCFVTTFLLSLPHLDSNNRANLQLSTKDTKTQSTTPQHIPVLSPAIISYRWVILLINPYNAKLYW